MDVKVLANIRKTCRTCLRVLESRKDLISMFDIDQTYPLKKLKISEMLASITNLTVSCRQINSHKVKLDYLMMFLFSPSIMMCFLKGSA